MPPEPATQPKAAVAFWLRPAKIEDAEPLARLAAQLGYPSSREQVERRFAPLLDQPEHAIFVAEAADENTGRLAAAQIVGWVHGFVERTVESDATVEIGGLVIDEAWRGRGIGRTLLRHLERWASGIGCSTITVRSNVIRERAHAFYRSQGYTITKTQRVFRKTVEVPKI